jgi:hypothetical protein
MSSRRNHGAILSRLIRVILPCVHVLGPNGNVNARFLINTIVLEAQILIYIFKEKMLKKHSQCQNTAFPITFQKV